MPEVEYRQDAPTDTLVGIAKGATGREIRVRVQPTLWDYKDRCYRSWAGQTWMVKLAKDKDAREFLEALRMFFKWIGQPGGVSAAIQTMTAVMAQGKGK